MPSLLNTSIESLSMMYLLPLVRPVTTMVSFPVEIMIEELLAVTLNNGFDITSPLLTTVDPLLVISTVSLYSFSFNGWQ